MYLHITYTKGLYTATKKNAILVFATIGLEGIQHGNSDKPSSESKVWDLMGQNRALE